jgi:beta-glucosidase
MNVNLGGDINLIGREPRDGRAFETKGEDPVLAGKITAAQLKAIQDQHVIADIKHFSLNDQETGRGQANVLIDDRSARASDLLAFEIGVKDSGVQSAMCSYNLLNGTYSCENPYLLSTVLKGDWALLEFHRRDSFASDQSGRFGGGGGGGEPAHHRGDGKRWSASDALAQSGGRGAGGVVSG